MGRQQFEQFDVGELIRTICEIYQPVIEEQGLSIEVQGRSDLPFVGNRQMIGRAVANLIDNALKYGAGGESLGLSASDHGDSVEIVVGDHGPGIPQHLREDAVRKYRRLEEARTTEGSGLGLAMARAVARLHGGDIMLEDNDPGLRVRLLLRRERTDIADV
jgi:signal transduction histidine kinase